MSTAERLLTLNEKSYGATSEEAGEALLDLGVAQRAYGQYERASASFERAQRLLSDRTLRSSLLVNWWSVQLRQFAPEKALALVGTVRHELADATAPYGQVLLLRLGAQPLALQGNYPGARALQAEAVRVAETAFLKADGSPADLVSSLSELAETEATLGNPRQARLYLDRALRLTSEAPAAPLLTQAAGVAADMLDFEQALSTYERALVMLNKFGSSVPDLAEPLLGVAAVAESTLQLAEAEKTAQRAAGLVEDGLAEQHALRWTALVALARQRGGSVATSNLTGP